MIVGIDIDGTLNYFTESLAYNVELQGYTFDITRFKKEGAWELDKFIIGSDNPRYVMDSICSEIDFWRDLQPRRESIPVLQNLNTTMEVYIVTTPWKDTEEYREVKIEWLHHHYPFIDDSQIIFSNNKWTLDLDLIIDDKPKTIEKCYQQDIITLCFAQPYNKSIPCDYRTNNWNNIENYISSIKLKRRQYERN